MEASEAPTPTSPVFFEASSRTQTMAQPEVDTLDQLQTPQQVELLDKIDELRNQGLGHHGISLPQLIVCGDQSSGKSSLLEGLTRLRFPAKEGVCTSFATEVVLRKEAEVEISCTITPGESRSPTERRELTKFKRTFTSKESFMFQSVTDQAKEQMGRGTKTNRGSFFEDVLRVRYSGPDLPSLTIVDLPGLIETQLDGGNGAERVAELVTGYMRDEKSIILAVTVADNDPENQKVFTYLKEFDPKGSRTLGIITKPDKVERGGDNEKEMMRLAKNEKLVLKHRWHAVRNRSFATREQTAAERDEAERKFFSGGVWASFPSEDVGIAALRVKLSRVLLEHIGRELPSLVVAVQNAIATTHASLNALGTARDTPRQQRSYLTGHAEKFQMLTNDALRGIYSNPFFALSSPDEPATARLRTEVQNLNIAFAQIMYHKGHTWNITTGQNSHPSIPRDKLPCTVQEYSDEFEEPMVITRADFLTSHIHEYVRQSRPSGLPSLVNPWVIGEIFRQQSQNWRHHANHHLQRVFQAVTDYIEEALGSLMDPQTCGMLMLKHVRPELDQRWRAVEEKMEELLIPYTEQDPITYDPNFIRELDDIRAARYTSATTQHSTLTPYTNHRKQQHHHQQSTPQHLLTESLDDYTNSEILDLMQTYYKNAISLFIANTTVLGIENCLLKNLPAIFSPSLTADMPDEMLSAIASESEELRSERLALKARLQVLESGREVLFEHIAMCPTTRKSGPKSKTKTKVKRPSAPSRASDANKTKEREIKRCVTPEIVEDLAEQLDELVVTPPPSRARPRVDSVAATPSPQEVGKRAWSPRYDVPRVAVERDSDDEDEY